MKRKFYGVSIIFLLLVFVMSHATFAQEDTVCETDVVVQASDWLSKIAEKAYGDPLAFSTIVEATNAKSTTDSSYAVIADPNVIEPGWKLCLPQDATSKSLDQSVSDSETSDTVNTESNAKTDTDTETDDEANADSIIQVNFLQMNDVYEMTPVSGQGGLARIATVRKQLLEETPNTYLVLAGDLFSPSSLGVAKVDGERLAGKQMVAVMNELGLDFMTFGNHEFDLSEEAFFKRLEEAEFTLFSSNVFDAEQNPLPSVDENYILTVSDDAGNELKIGLFGLTIGSNPVSYVTFADVTETAKKQVDLLKDDVDILIGLTHLPLEQDTELVTALAEIDFIMGGHEHENVQVWRGADYTPIFKADANARGVYIHRLFYNTETDELQIDSELMSINDTIIEDPTIKAVVDEWFSIGLEGFRADGFEPQNVIATITNPLDGLESSVRNFPTNLANLIALSMVNVASGTELAIFNSGSIRIDDIIQPGPITEYDIIRTLPFGGEVLAIEMKGSLLEQILNISQLNKGNGGYLQTANVTIAEDRETWLINDVELDENQTYKVAINDFLLTGREHNLDFLTTDNSELTVIEEYGDIRMAFIAELKRQYPAK